MAGFCTSTRIKATSWRCPIERRLPRSPTSVCKPSGKIERFALANSMCHFEHLIIAHFGLSIADVLRHRTREQERHLRNDPQLAAIGLQIKGAEIVPVNRQRTRLELVEARDQLGNRRLARASVPNQGQILSGLDAQVEVPENRFLVRITEKCRFSKQPPPKLGTSRSSVWMTLGSASISAKARSAAANPCWICAQNADRFSTGKKNWSRLMMNRYHAPAVTMPCSMLNPPT